MLRVPVVSPDGKPLMPTKPSRARRWIRDGLAVKKWSDLGVFYVQLIQQSSGRKTAKKGLGFSPVMVGQKWMLKQLAKLAHTSTLYGWETAVIRQQLGLIKEKKAKSNQSPETHAVDGISLASSQFLQYRQLKGKQGWWDGDASITSAPFVIIRRPPVSRRQLHLMIPAKGGKRRKYGGTTTRHEFRKGDLVKAEMAGRVSIGWVSGDTEKQVSVSDLNWKRLGQFTASKVQLLCRATGLLVSPQCYLSIIGASNPNN